MDEKWLKLAEYCKGISQLCQALAESIENQSETKAEEKTETKEADEQPVTLEIVSTLAKKKAAEGKSAEVKAVITECGVKKLSDIPQELYADVLKKLEAI